MWSGMGAMRSNWMALLILAAVVGTFASGSLAGKEQEDQLLGKVDKGNAGGNGEQLCCDKCGMCTRSIPPRCTCLDTMLSCPPWCKSCVPSLPVNSPSGYVCLDRIKNYCEKRCTFELLGSE